VAYAPQKHGMAVELLCPTKGYVFAIKKTEREITKELKKI